MGYEMELDGKAVAYLGKDNVVRYNNEVIKEIIAGKATGGSFSTNARVVYKWDRNRTANNDMIYALWKSNPIIQNRIRGLNSLVFGRGFKYSYEEKLQNVVDRFWSMNRLRRKLSPMGTDSQLYGETFIGLFPQDSGDVLTAIYDTASVEIDFNPSNVDDINEYVVTYKNEETNKDEQIKFYPCYKFLNEVEFASPLQSTIRKVRRALSKSTLPSGYTGVMIHIKFNNSVSEIHGTSDFRQVYGVIADYMGFRSDRMAIHQVYGSPMFDIQIDTDDPDVITTRIEELADFTIGSNPVHNKNETWTALEFKGNADSAEHDEKAMRGLICAGTGFPEYILFNQPSGKQDESGAFTLNKIAEDVQDAFGEAIMDMHKFVAYQAGIDIDLVNKGQIIFPEISTMSEKTKAETYVLKVGAGICSRETASYNTGHNWKVEEDKILTESTMFADMMSDPYNAGRIGGRFSNRLNNQDPNRDDGSDDKDERLKAQNKSTQTMGNRKTNN